MLQRFIQELTPDEVERRYRQWIQFQLISAYKMGAMLARIRQHPTKFILNIVTSMRLVPFTWTWNEHHANGGPSMHVVPELDKNRGEPKRSGYPFYLIYVFLTWAHAIFETVMLAYYWPEYVARGMPPTVYFHMLWVLGMVWISIYHIHFLLYRNDIATTINSLVAFNDKLERIHGGTEYRKYCRLQGIITWLLVLSCLEVQMSVFVMCIKKPHLHQFLVSLVPRGSRTLGVTVGVGLGEWALYAFFGGPVMVECYLNLYFFYTTQIGLRFLMKNSNSLKPGQAYRIYQALHLLTDMYNEAFGKFMIFGMKSTMGILTCTSILGFIHGVKNGSEPIFIAAFLTLSVFSIFTQLFLYPKASSIHMLSKKFCDGYNAANIFKVHGHGHAGVDDCEPSGSKSKPRPGRWPTQTVLLSYHERVLLKSRMKPFAVAVGGMYKMKQSTPAMFLDIVINYTLAVLLG